MSSPPRRVPLFYLPVCRALHRTPAFVRARCNSLAWVGLKAVHRFLFKRHHPHHCDVPRESYSYSHCAVPRDFVAIKTPTPIGRLGWGFRDIGMFFYRGGAPAFELDVSCFYSRLSFSAAGRMPWRPSPREHSAPGYQVYTSGTWSVIRKDGRPVALPRFESTASTTFYILLSFSIALSRLQRNFTY